MTDDSAKFAENCAGRLVGSACAFVVLAFDVLYLTAAVGDGGVLACAAGGAAVEIGVTGTAAVGKTAVVEAGGFAAVDLDAVGVVAAVVVDDDGAVAEVSDAGVAAAAAADERKSCCSRYD